MLAKKVDEDTDDLDYCYGKNAEFTSSLSNRDNALSNENSSKVGSDFPHYEESTPQRELSYSREAVLSIHFSY